MIKITNILWEGVASFFSVEVMEKCATEFVHEISSATKHWMGVTGISKNTDFSYININYENHM
jgi:hypothetical protein